MRAVILGCSSFAGSSLAEDLLASGFHVLGASRRHDSPSSLLTEYQENPNYFYFELNLLGDHSEFLSLLVDWKPTHIFDFMGQGMVEESWVNPGLWYQTNVSAKALLLKGLVENLQVEQFVRVSTPEVYGSCDQLILENHPFNPTTPYAVSHAAVDMHLAALFHRYQFPVVIGRFANFYGPGQPLYRLVSGLLHSIQSGHPFSLHGTGETRRCFLYQSDFVAALKLLASQGKSGNIYHVSPNKSYSIVEVIKIACDIHGVNMDAIVEPAPDRPSKDAQYLMSSDKIKQDLGWLDKVSLENGISKTSKWMRLNWSEVKMSPKNYIVVE